MSRPTARVLALLELLQSGGVRSVGELSDRLGVDRRTVRRYVDHLLDLDVPVESVRGRYGGYRLGSGYRLPPLMLDEDEAIEVLLGLAAGRRSRGTEDVAAAGAAAATAAETAAAKIRRVLPRRLADRVDALLAAAAFTTPAPAPAAPGAVLLPLADAVRHRRPVRIRYTAADGRRSDRVVHPDGLVVHAGRWYVTGTDPAVGEERTFRLDRIGDVRAMPGSFSPSEDVERVDPTQRVLRGLATAPRRHTVRVLVGARQAEIAAVLPPSLATLEEVPALNGDGPWFRAELQVEDLRWLPPLLASLDRPFLIEEPEELRVLTVALAERLSASAGRSDPAAPRA